MCKNCLAFSLTSTARLALQFFYVQSENIHFEVFVKSFNEWHEIDLQAGLRPEFILFITGSEEEMERRVLSRNEVCGFNFGSFFLRCGLQKSANFADLDRRSFLGFLCLAFRAYI